MHLCLSVFIGVYLRKHLLLGLMQRTHDHEFVASIPGAGAREDGGGNFDVAGCGVFHGRSGGMAACWGIVG